MRIVLLLSLVVSVSACDPIYGVSRRARVAVMPDPAQVRTIVQRTPGVERVSFQQTKGGKPITLTGVRAADQVYTFNYHGGTDVYGSLQFIVDYKNQVEYSQTLLRMFEPPPQAWIDATLPVMKRIESRLESETGLSGLQGSVSQNCFRVKCP